MSPHEANENCMELAVYEKQVANYNLIIVASTANTRSVQIMPLGLNDLEGGHAYSHTHAQIAISAILQESDFTEEPGTHLAWFDLIANRELHQVVPFSIK